MFLVVFSSLAAVMAVVAQGNLRTAHSHQQVNRAYSAAETGLTFAARRIAEASARFVVERGVIDADLAEKLWDGTWDPDVDGQITVLPPEGFVEGTAATGIAEAVMNAHVADGHSVNLEEWHALLPDIDEFGKLVVKPILVDDDENCPTFQLSYEPLADGRYVRVTSVGRDGELTRTLQMDFQIVKRLDAAIISPNRIMVGKNVFIDGPIGSRYGENPEDLEADNGHPLVLRSDFRYLDDALDGQIDELITRIAEHDVDGDNRLRPTHPSESLGLTEPYMADFSGDGFVDDYDLWVGFYDTDDDGAIVYDTDLAIAAGLGSLSEEFSDIDDQLCDLIDSREPDRNGDGLVDAADTALGYLDGVVDNLDGYSKVRGSLLFKTSKSEWETAQGGIDYQSVVQGALRPDLEEAATNFQVSDTQLYDLDPEDFVNSQAGVKTAALDGLPFEDQVEAQLGGDLLTHVWSDHATDPDYLRAELGLWEQMPLGSPGFYDWYKRPIYKNMTFVNVTIPIGEYDPTGAYATPTFNNLNNGLFINCTFIGAVYAQTYSGSGQDHHNWNFLGMKEKIGNDYVDKYDYAYWDPPLMIPGYPDPILDTKPFSNNLRFHDCLIVGSIVTDSPDQFAHVRNKVQFTGNTRFSFDTADASGANLTPEELTIALQSFEDNREELEKSSLMAPNFSVDVGNFENQDEKVELKGTIVAGVMDIRGSAYIEGTLLMTYAPVEGEGALYYGGSAASFNTTIGYFGPDDGDGEGGTPTLAEGFGEITIVYNPELAMPDGIMAPLKAVFVSGTYHEGGEL